MKERIIENSDLEVLLPNSWFRQGNVIEDKAESQITSVPSLKHPSIKATDNPGRVTHAFNPSSSNSVARLVPGSCYALWSKDSKTLGLRPMALVTIGAEGPNRYDPFRSCNISRHHLPFPAIAIWSQGLQSRLGAVATVSKP